MSGRTHDSCGEPIPNKCLPLFHNYEVADDESLGHRKVICEKCGYWKVEKHFGQGVWL